MNSFGTRALPTPEGVPVMTTSPGSSVRPAESSAMIRATPKTIWLVLASCLVTPFTLVQMPRSCGSTSSSAVTIQGPSGRCVSKFFPLNHWPPCQSCCTSRTETSFPIVYPKTCPSALDSGMSMPPRPMTTASSTSQSSRSEIGAGWRIPASGPTTVFGFLLKNDGCCGSSFGSFAPRALVPSAKCSR